MRRTFRMAISLLAAAASSQAAYHYVHYATSTNFTPIYEKFNLAALPNNTVTFCVEDQGPSGYATNDTFGSVLAQIREALAAWNAISVTQLRVAYGGLESYTANPTVANALSGADTAIPGSNTPGADIIFVDTPGLLGMGAPTTSTVQVQGANGPFYPIMRGLVMLSQNTADPSGPGPSYTEEYFTTAVHEIGHALGLQHTWTSSAMSQDVIRNTSRARPLDADDIASLAVLYGNANWQTNYGSISGRVTFANSGAGVTLASVVAIAPTGSAVSTLTNPDGTYVIQGLPPNFSYLVYAHPLPPDAVPADNSGLRLPMVGTNSAQSFGPNGTFTTVFNAGASVTLDPDGATSYSVAPAVTTSSATTPATNFTNVNFSVQPNAGVPTYDVLTYSRIVSATRTYTYPGDTTISGYPAFMEPALGNGLVVAEASSPAVLPVPQSVTMLGGYAPALLNNGSVPTVVPYPGQPTMAIYFSLPSGSGYGPRHLVFNFGNDIYVLPSSVDLVQKGPPVLNSVTPNGDGTVTISGAGFGPDSRVFFDGMHAPPAVFSGADAQGALVVTPPQASSGQVSTVTVYNSDGQNSNILQTANPLTYTYPTNNAPQITAMVPATLAAGMAASIDISTSNTNFVDGQVAVGLGTADVTVRRVWVLSPTHLIADAVVAPNAAAALSEVSIVSGMQVVSQPNGFQAQPAPPLGTPVIALPIVGANCQPGIYPGCYASIYGLNLGTPNSGVQVLLNGQPMASSSTFATPGQINFQVPSNFAPGPAALTLSGLASPPPQVAIQIDKPAPVIMAVNTSAGTPATGSTVSSAGDTLNVLALGLDPALVNGWQGRLWLTVAGFPMDIQQVTAAANGALNIQVVLTQSFGASQVPVVVVQDGSPSAAATITVK
jgi:uncharacterized protein (TIGR03437 family)